MLKNKISLQILILLRQAQLVLRRCSAPIFSPVTRPLYSSIFLFLFFIIASLPMLGPARPPALGRNSANTRNTAFIIIGVKKKERASLSAIAFCFPHPKPVLKYNSCQLWVVPWNATINSPCVRRQTDGLVNNGIKVHIFNPCDSHLPLHMYNPNQESDTD